MSRLIEIREEDIFNGATYGQIRSTSSSYSTAANGSSMTFSEGGNRFGQDLLFSNYNIYQTFWRIDLSSIPQGGFFRDVRLYLSWGVIAEDTDFTLEIYQFDWGSTITTADWRTPSQLGTLRSGGKLLGETFTSGRSLGDAVLIPDTNLTSLFTTAYEAGDPYFYGVIASREQRNSSAPTDTEFQDLSSTVNNFGEVWMELDIEHAGNIVTLNGELC